LDCADVFIGNLTIHRQTRRVNLWMAIVQDHTANLIPVFCDILEQLSVNHPVTTRSLSLIMEFAHHVFCRANAKPPQSVALLTGTQLFVA